MERAFALSPAHSTYLCQAPGGILHKARVSMEVAAGTECRWLPRLGVGLSARPSIQLGPSCLAVPIQLSLAPISLITGTPGRGGIKGLW